MDSLLTSNKLGVAWEILPSRLKEVKTLICHKLTTQASMIKAYLINLRFLIIGNHPMHIHLNLNLEINIYHINKTTDIRDQSLLS